MNDLSASTNQILDKEMEEIRKLDLGELKDAKAELLGHQAEKEYEMDSISNKIGEPSTFTKMTGKS